MPLTHLRISEGGPVVQHGVIVQQLDIPWLKRVVHAEVIPASERVKVLQSFLLLLRQAGHLWMPLRQLVVRCAVVDAQVALRGVQGLFSDLPHT